MSTETMPWDAGRIRAIRTRLLDFYDEGRRDLPWRESLDPYRIWVSEVMLQQTRVDTVVPYYRRWMERFPTVEVLAEASSEEVLRLWQGLGYYSRARNLHNAARVVVEAWDGVVPNTVEALRQLPGVGEYTAGAVASIAFGAPVPAVDGNVRRVLARLADDPDPTPARLRRWAGALVDPERPGDFNQGLMELGALVCTPRAPGCARCPLEAECRARREGTQELRPLPRRRGRVRRAVAVSLVLHRGTGAETEVLLERRPDDGLLGGMWSTPTRELSPEAGNGVREGAESDRTKVDEASPVLETLRGLLRTTMEDAGLPFHSMPGRKMGAAKGADSLPPVDHAFTHLRVRYLPFRIPLVREDGDPDGSPDPPPDTSFRWVPLVARGGVPLPVAQESILASLESEIGEGAEGGPVP
jgi:A/G-specific adenine glycosylase